MEVEWIFKNHLNCLLRYIYSNKYFYPIFWLNVPNRSLNIPFPFLYPSKHIWTFTDSHHILCTPCSIHLELGHSLTIFVGIYVHRTRDTIPVIFHLHMYTHIHAVTQVWSILFVVNRIRAGPYTCCNRLLPIACMTKMTMISSLPWRIDVQFKFYINIASLWN